jgi:hypothetical protein
MAGMVAFQTIVTFDDAFGTEKDFDDDDHDMLVTEKAHGVHLQHNTFAIALVYVHLKTTSYP